MDVIKFLCKDLWTILFRKQIDNLKTNHRVGNMNAFADGRGVYVLTDNSFKWFSRMSTVTGAQDAINKAQPVSVLIRYLTIVPLVPMWSDSWSPFKSWHRKYSDGRNNTPWSPKRIVPDQSR